MPSQQLPFGPATRQWFTSTFPGPTAAQSGAWQAISAGQHALIVAPTGSGKTLAAFLWSLDRLAHHKDRPRRCRVLYLSPLKALAVDVDRNLRSPLEGIRAAAQAAGQTPPDITVSIRTGDTPANERRAFARHPADILITTPESLFLLLTSAAREALRDVETVIVDEIHALCGTKRGAHLALSLERLDALLERPAQRVGLSATVRPVERAAAFLCGSAPVTVVAPESAKTIEVRVVVPVPDLSDLPRDPQRGERTVWPAVEEQILELVKSHHSTIIFVNGRRTAERLCSRLNELAEQLVARTHHGSMSREERQLAEESLKSGSLPAVVATSSLELGIDMGQVDLVIQVESPPNIAAGLQRVGRAGHHVGVVSRGVIFPKHRGDLLSCAVVAERMTTGQIEQLRVPRNPLDVLAQQLVAMVAMDSWSYSDLATLVRKAAPFTKLPDSALRAVMDMLSGRYPSTAFAELRPRLVWDRTTDRITGRPGAQRLAVTNAGTIPDRGLYGVFLAEQQPRGRSGRVGELDEEMVYESRVGDVFRLGATSWRIEEITPDRVLVSPAPGAPARMPFWHGEGIGRPLELGIAIGQRLRRLAVAPVEQSRTELRASGLDDWAVDNLLSYLDQQRQVTQQVPDHQTMVFERFRDELGDWRVAVHCVLGAQVNGAWGLAIGHRITQRYGFDGQIVPSDDGILIRLPDMADQPPPADLVIFDPEEITHLVEQAVGGSAMFAGRFRECAARALLLPHRNPGRRQPLWQQRLRAAQLLDIARQYPDFPVTLEAARECLQDLLDLPGLTQVMRDLATGQTRLLEVTSPRPSPFARSLLFGYIGAFLYEGDAPLAERRAAALSLDPTLLGELLGRPELQELLDPEIIDQVEPQLRYLNERQAPTSPDQVCDLLRIVGDLTEAELAMRKVEPATLQKLRTAGRILPIELAGQRRWIVVEDAARYRDALGIRLPEGLAAAHLEPAPNPLGDLLGRYAATHGPFATQAPADRFGLGTAVVEPALRQLATRGELVAGGFRTSSGPAQWCGQQVLRVLRNRSLAALRSQIEPVPPAALARFLPAWQQVNLARLNGLDGVLCAVEQLQGALIPASTLERSVLPVRVPGYQPAWLDELCSAGEVVWAGAGALNRANGGQDGWVSLALGETAAAVLPGPPLNDLEAGQQDPAVDLGLRQSILEVLSSGAALRFQALLEQVEQRLGSRGPAAGSLGTALAAALWELVWAGLVSGDTLVPLRARLRTASHPAAAVTAAGGTGSAGTGSGGGTWAGNGSRVRYRRPGRLALAAPRIVSGDTTGRWYRLPQREAEPAARLAALTEVLLERHGVLTRAAVAAERFPGGFASAYQVLAAMEERGTVRRGYFVEGLGAAQFALPGAVDQLRDQPAAEGLLLTATDPANPYGAALPWPERGGCGDDPGHRPGRKPGALVVLVDGELVLYVERGGRTMLTYAAADRADGPVGGQRRLADALLALADGVRTGRTDPLRLEMIDGNSALGSRIGPLLTQVGFRTVPQGFALRT